MTTTYDADERGWFGGPETGWGGRFMPEALVAALDELTEAWQDAMADPTFVAEFAASMNVSLVISPSMSWTIATNSS